MSMLSLSLDLHGFFFRVTPNFGHIYIYKQVSINRK